MESIKETVKEYGIELLIDKDFKVPGMCLAVECDLDIKIDLDWINNCVLKKTTKRSTDFYCKFNQQENKMTITFFTACPEAFYELVKNNIDGFKTQYTTFVDMCWQYSEGTTSQSVGEVATEVRQDGSLAGDLTWLLPSKFVDDFIEMVHTINPDFMSGLMQDCIVYGPYILKNV